MPKKIILITGATRGWAGRWSRSLRGWATLFLAAAGQEEIDQLRRRFGRPHAFQVVDVAVDKEVKLWANQLLDSHAAPDLLLNNAGVINKNAPLWQIDAADSPASSM